MKEMFNLKKSIYGQNPLEPGHVLEVGKDKGVFLDDDYNVYAVILDTYVIQIGSISPINLKHFIQEESKPYDTINVIVFLGDFTYGIKQFEDPIVVFNSLSEKAQAEIISEYLELRDSRDNTFSGLSLIETKI
jgi:hypothetical protein